MPFMPQRTGPPTNSALRALQGIMMQRMQQNYEARKRQEVYKQAEKERKENYNYQKSLMEYKHLLGSKPTEAEDRSYQLLLKKFNLEKDLREAQIKSENADAEARIEKTNRENEAYAKYQMGIATPEDLKLINMYVKPPQVPASTINYTDKMQRQEEAYKGLESNLGQFIINFRKQENEDRGGTFLGMGKKSTEAGKSNMLLPYEQRLIKQMMTMIKMGAVPGMKQMSLMEVYDTIKKKIKEQPDFSFEVPQTKLNEMNITQPKY